MIIDGVIKYDNNKEMEVEKEEEFDDDEDDKNENNITIITYYLWSALDYTLE